jgi:hypothetical protein
VDHGVMNANGTDHDFPSRQNCRDCHEELRSKVLGFGAIQLDGSSGMLDLEDLITQGKLTVNPTSGAAGARFPIPGGTAVVNAVGYMHANCAHCHNPTANNFNHTPTDMRLRVGALGNVNAIPAYMTLVDKTSSLGYVHDDGTPYTLLIDGSNANNSILAKRLVSTNAMKHMPNKGSEMDDPTGLNTLTTWINGLP